MAIAVAYKRPNEIIAIGVDFAGAVPSGDTTLTNTSVTAINSSDIADASVVGTVSSSGLVLTALLQAGTDGEDYTVTYQTKSSTSGKGPFERTIELRVRTKIGIGHV